MPLSNGWLRRGSRGAPPQEPNPQRSCLLALTALPPPETKKQPLKFPIWVTPVAFVCSEASAEASAGPGRTRTRSPPRGGGGGDPSPSPPRPGLYSAAPRHRRRQPLLRARRPPGTDSRRSSRRDRGAPARVSAIPLKQNWDLRAKMSGVSRTELSVCSLN